LIAAFPGPAVDLLSAAGDTNAPLTLPPFATRYARSSQENRPVITMKHANFQLQGLTDPRLAVHATGAFPAWLWSSDGTRILWANPVGASVFGASNATELARTTLGPADGHRRQIAQLAARLPSNGAVRIQRLRGFGAPLGMPATCACAVLWFADENPAILVAAVTGAGRPMAMPERLKRLVSGIAAPVAAFDRDGSLIAASAAAHALPGFEHLSKAGLADARRRALADGRFETRIDIGQLLLQRVGIGVDAGIVALIMPVPAQAAPSQHATIASNPEPAGEAAAISGEAPAEADEPVFPPCPEPTATDDEDACSLDEPTPRPRLHPLRFTWHMDADGRFLLGSTEFVGLIGPRIAAAFGRPWSEIAERLELDRDGGVAKAIASRDTWSGITLDWPVDGGGNLPVDLAGLPVFDRERSFAGYRGFGVCRDLDGLTRLAALRRFERLTDPPAPHSLSADIVLTDFVQEPPAAERFITSRPRPEPPALVLVESSPETDLEQPVETPANVVPFRPVGEPKMPALTHGENSAFDEIARQLSARLEAASGTAVMRGDGPVELAANEQPEWLAEPEPPARGDADRDRLLFDLLPTGVLIYRLDRLLYANPAFLERLGYPSLLALEQAGGLDALYVEAGVSSASSTSEAGMPVTISAGPGREGETHPATEARLFTISWDGDSALALIFSPGTIFPQTEASRPATATVPPSPPPAAGQATAEELGAILDTTAEGIVMFDAEGDIHTCNRSAEALFGYEGADLVRRNLIELFAPESQRGVQDYLRVIKATDAASLLEHGREVLGRVRQGGVIPISLTMGRTRAEGPNFFAVFRDLSHSKKNESELQQARRLVDRAATAKADMLARISHGVRSPLNAIIGVSEVMLAERFGALGHERYAEYMKDIRASGERVIAMIDDLLELSRIETGKLELTFANQNLNELVEACVAMMQPQANRERIIIRTSLAQRLPPVVADIRALRQITQNLIGNSIQLAKAGGQVIVSTALSDFGEAILRVRDTGHGLNESEVAAALEPFRTSPPSDQGAENSGIHLSLTKALAEANRAKFHIKAGVRSGTLIELVFARALART
jgi:PAS domain S-box-containing protein